MLRNFRIKLSNNEIERKLAYDYVYKRYPELHLVFKISYESFKKAEYIYVYEDNSKQLRATHWSYAKYLKTWITLNLNYSKLLSLSIYKSDFVEMNMCEPLPFRFSPFFLKYGFIDKIFKPISGKLKCIITLEIFIINGLKKNM